MSVKGYVTECAKEEVVKNCKWECKEIMFSLVHPNSSSVINLIITAAKQFIYRQRCLGSSLYAQAFIFECEQLYNIEYNIASNLGKLNKHYTKWGMLKKDLEMSEQEERLQQEFIAQYLAIM